MQKQILLDLGGVVFQASGVTNDIIQWNVINALNDRYGHELNIGEDLFPDFMADYNTRTGQALSGAEFLSEVFDTLDFNAPLVEFLQNQGAISIVSDNYRENIAYISQRFAFDTWASAQFYSFDLGLEKSDAQFFPELLRRMGVDAAQCILIDDSPAKISSAEAHGIAGLLFTSNENVFAHFQG